MIRPQLPKLASGTRLTTDLVNGIINRTEYAADLLRQYKLTAGNGMYVEPHYDGTRVSYLQPVAGGATPTQPISPAYRIVVQATVGGIVKSFLYNGSTFTDIIDPSATQTFAQGIDGVNIVGSSVVGGVNRGFLYNGSTFTTLSVPSSSFTIPYGVDGSNIVGRTRLGSGFDRGFLYNGSTFTTFLVPSSTFTQALGIDGSNIVGQYRTINNVDRGFLYNGSTFTDIVPPNSTETYSYGIDGSNIVGSARIGGDLFITAQLLRTSLCRAARRLLPPASTDQILLDMQVSEESIGVSYTTAQLSQI
jgi:hypothetical protein